MKPYSYILLLFLTLCGCNKINTPPSNDNSEDTMIEEIKDSLTPSIPKNTHLRDLQGYRYGDVLMVYKDDVPFSGAAWSNDNKSFWLSCDNGQVIEMIAYMDNSEHIAFVSNISTEQSINGKKHMPTTLFYDENGFPKILFHMENNVEKIPFKDLETDMEGYTTRERLKEEFPERTKIYNRCNSMVRTELNVKQGK